MVRVMDPVWKRCVAESVATAYSLPRREWRHCSPAMHRVKLDLPKGQKRKEDNRPTKEDRRGARTPTGASYVRHVALCQTELHCDCRGIS